MLRIKLPHAPWLCPGKVLTFCCILTPSLPPVMLGGFWGEQVIWATLRRTWGGSSLLPEHPWALRQGCCLLEWFWLEGETGVPGPHGLPSLGPLCRAA